MENLEIVNFWQYASKLKRIMFITIIIVSFLFLVLFFSGLDNLISSNIVRFLIIGVFLVFILLIMFKSASSFNDFALFMLPFFIIVMHLRVPPQYLYQRISDVLFVVLLICFLSENKNSRLQINIGHVYFFIFFISIGCVLSSIVSDYPEKSLYVFYDLFKYSIIILVLLPKIINSKKRMTYLIAGFVFASFISALIGISQFLIKPIITTLPLKDRQPIYQLLSGGSRNGKRRQGKHRLEAKCWNPPQLTSFGIMLAPLGGSWMVC